MEEKLAGLLEEVVKSLSERLLKEQYPLGKKNPFLSDPLLDHLIFDIFCDHLAANSAYAQTISEFIKLDKKEQNGFDSRLRERVYDYLYKAHGGLA